MGPDRGPPRKAWAGASLARSRADFTLPRPGFPCNRRPTPAERGKTPGMTELYDVAAIGNAIVDVMAPCEDALIEELGLNRGGMTLVDTARANELYDAMGPAREISGGSAANTLAGMSALGAQCAFIGQVADDQLGQIFAHDIRSGGIDFDTPPRATSNDESDPPTARCLIFVLSLIHI